MNLKKTNLLIILLLLNIHMQAKRYLIQSLKVSCNQITAVPESYLVRKFLDKDVFITTYENDINLKDLDYETVTAPLILSVISFVWASGKTYYIEKMDEELAKSLDVIKEVYRAFYPEIKWRGRLIADELTNKKTLAKKNYINDEIVGICFSGGLDSTYSSLTYNDKKQLLFTIHGFSEESDYGRWTTIKEQVSNFANSHGNRTPFFIRSNFRRLTLGPKTADLYPTLIPWREYCQEALSLAGVLIPLLEAHNCEQLIIPSTFTWDFPYAWGSHPFIDNNIKFKNISVTHHTPNASRKNKIEFFKNRALKGATKPTLYSCRHGKKMGPCGSCMKGITTVNIILLAGENPKDYGYPHGMAGTIEETKKILSCEYPFENFDKSEAIEWEKIQGYAAQMLKNDDVDENLKEYLIWLQKINFRKFINNPRDFKTTINFKKYSYFLSKKWKDQLLKKLSGNPKKK